MTPTPQEKKWIEDVPWQHIVGRLNSDGISAHFIDRIAGYIKHLLSSQKSALVEELQSIEKILVDGQDDPEGHILGRNILKIRLEDYEKVIESIKQREG